MPLARLTRGLVLACHVRLCRCSALSVSPSVLRCGGWQWESSSPRRQKGKRRDDNKAVVLQLCHSVGLGMNTFTVSFLVFLFQTLQGVKTGIYSVDQEIGKQEDWETGR